MVKVWMVGEDGEGGGGWEIFLFGGIFLAGTFVCVFLTEIY